MIVRYGQHYRQMFEAFVPNELSNVLVLLIHGGSWVAGDKGQLAPVGRYLTQQGFSAVTMNYRLAPEVTYKGMLEDIATVVRMIEADPQLYGLQDDFSLVMMGYSAGGHLAALTSVLEERLGIQPVALCIGLAGIYDLERIIDGRDGAILVEPATMVVGNESAATASPTALVPVNESTSFLLYWGEHDDVVAAAQMDAFAQRVADQNGAVDAIRLPDRNHQDVFAYLTSGDEMAQVIVNKLRELEEAR